MALACPDLIQLPSSAGADQQNLQPCTDTAAPARPVCARPSKAPAPDIVWGTSGTVLLLKPLKHLENGTSGEGVVYEEPEPLRCPRPRDAPHRHWGVAKPGVPLPLSNVDSQLLIVANIFLLLEFSVSLAWV